MAPEDEHQIEAGNVEPVAAEAKPPPSHIPAKSLVNVEEKEEEEEEEETEYEDEDEELESLENSPQIKISNVPASTDSMVTVRLSEPVSTPTLPIEHDTASVRSDETVEPRHSMLSQKRRSSVEILRGVDLDAEADPDVHQDDESATSSLHPRDSVFTAGTKGSEDPFSDSQPKVRHSRSDSSSSSRSDSSGMVDWTELEKTEESEARDETTDESTAFLLARLEQENKALATDPRFNALKGRTRNQSRPPSIHVLKQLVSDRNSGASRFSTIPTSPPPMTELEFWAALVKDYRQTAQRLPTLTANKIKGGVPPPLRGVVWMSMVGARDRDLGDQYDKLVLETSPYESLIGKDIGRSFPGVEMFRDPEGEGQQMLAKVLKAFSLYDKQIGYCQGLGFLVGPLLMQMGDKDAFCVLVKLMENYDLRSCFLPNLEGLHLRIYQFQSLLTQHMPILAEHLKSIEVEAAYLSQWFLSFFAVTCPLPMLFRIYDIIFAEGASETIMRVALSLMRRNEQKIMASMEFEEVMQLLLSRSLWEAYNCDADDLVNDFMDMTGIVTRDSLKALEASFKPAAGAVGEVAAWYGFIPDATAAASRFLGRMWTSHTPSKSQSLAPVNVPAAASRPGSILRHTPSKQSIASTMNSTDMNSEGSNSVGTVTTETTVTSRDSTGDALSVASKADSIVIPVPGIASSKEDKDLRALHNQIEDLLTAMSDMQRQHAMLTAELQKEREERSEDHHAIEALVEQVKGAFPANAGENVSVDRRQTLPHPLLPAQPVASIPKDMQDAIHKVDERLEVHRELRRSLMLETKQRLRESLVRSRDQLQVEMSRSAELSRQLDEQEQETNKVREKLRDAQIRLQDNIKEKAKLEKTIQEARRYSISVSDMERVPHLSRSDTSNSRMSVSSGAGLTSPTGTGLRELRLGRPDSVIGQAGASTSGPPRRTSSLATQKVLSTEDHAPASEDSLLVELVNAKTSEAVARQELEEVKAKLDAMRKMLGVPSPPVMSSSSAPSIFSTSKSPLVPKADSTPKSAAVKRSGSESSDKSSPTQPTSSTATSAATAASSFGASIWGWGKRSVSFTTTPTVTPSKGAAAAADATLATISGAEKS